MPFIELYRGGRTRDYPFGFLQIKLNEKDEGGGQIMVAAKIRFDKKQGRYEIESCGYQRINTTNVRREEYALLLSPKEAWTGIAASR